MNCIGRLERSSDLWSPTSVNIEHQHIYRQSYSPLYLCTYLLWTCLFHYMKVFIHTRTRVSVKPVFCLHGNKLSRAVTILKPKLYECYNCRGFYCLPLFYNCFISALNFYQEHKGESKPESKNIVKLYSSPYASSLYAYMPTTIKRK